MEKNYGNKWGVFDRGEDEEKKKRMSRYQVVNSNKSSFNEGEEINDPNDDKNEDEKNNDKNLENTIKFNKEEENESRKKAVLQTKKITSKIEKKVEININKKSKFKVNFQDIKLENLLSENINCFVVFIIGNNIKVLNNSENNNKNIDLDNGKSFISGYEDNIEKNNSRKLNLNIKEIFYFNQSDLENKFIIIQVWLYSKWSVNTLFGEKYIKLINLAKGNISREEKLWGFKDGSEKHTCNISFRGYFQEKWKYRMKFLDLKINNIRNKNGDLVNPSIKIEITDGKFGHKSVSTKILNKTSDCRWSEIENEIRFSGALYELEEQDLIIKLYDNHTFSSDILFETLISLKGLIISKILQIPIRLIGKLPDLDENINDKSIEIELNNQKVKENPFDSDTFISYLEGKIKFIDEPIYRQKGDLFILNSDFNYLGLNIGKIENLNAPENIGIINSFLNCQWGNQNIKTKIIHDNFSPNFNEEIYFKLPLINSKKKKNKEFFVELKRLLLSRPDIKISLWLINNEKDKEYLGYCSILIKEIISGDMKEIEFYDSKLKVIKKNKVRVKTLKKKLISNSIGNNTYVNLSLFLLPDFDNNDIDLTDLTVNENLKINPMIYKKIKDNFNSIIYKEWIYIIKDCFENLEKNRLENFNKIFIKDQSGYERFLSTFIEPININFEKPLNIKYFYSNLRTSLEIFHFVNCIQFNDSFKNILFSPDFMLTQNKGSIADHSILLCCLLMGCKYENLDDYNQKFFSKKKNNNYFDEIWDTYEYRTFVCIGQHKNINKLAFWVMTISRDLNRISFWDVEDGLIYNWDGRIRGKNQNNLKNFLLNINDNINTNEENLTEKKEKNKKKSEDWEFESNLRRFDQNNLELEIGLNENDEIFLDDKIKHQMERGTYFRKNENKREEFNFIEKKRKDDLEKLKDDKIKNQMPNHSFHIKQKKVKDNVILPFKSIELIFNNKNAWANLQNSDPTKIFYDLSNSELWLPFLTRKNNNKQKKIAQMINVGTFYHIKNLEKPLRIKKIEITENKIEKNIIYNIKCARSGLNLETDIKNNNESLKKLFKLYLDYLEVIESGQNNKNYGNLITSWIENLKKKIPANYHCSYLPLRFNINDTERIRLIINENFKEFYIKVKKLCIFVIVCKVYPYPNNINSIRILISYLYLDNKYNEELEENKEWEAEDSLIDYS